MDLPVIAEELGRLESPSVVDDLLYSAAPGSFWNWGVVLLTAVSTALAAAAVGLLLSKLQLSRFRRRKTLIRLPSFYSSCSDDDDASISSSDGEEDDDEGEMDEMEEREEEGEESEDFGRVKVSEMGNFSFSLADLAGGAGVVKAWDGLGLGFNRDRGSVSFIDINSGEILRSFNGSAAETTAVQLASPTEIVSAADAAGGAVVRVWDARAGSEAPAASARPLLRRRVAGVMAREGKVFVGDEGGEVAALDLRNVAAVVQSGESFGSWWRSAAKCLTLLSPRLENA